MRHRCGNDPCIQRQSPSPTTSPSGPIGAGAGAGTPVAATRRGWATPNATARAAHAARVRPNARAIHVMLLPRTCMRRRKPSLFSVHRRSATSSAPPSFGKCSSVHVAIEKVSGGRSCSGMGNPKRRTAARAHAQASSRGSSQKAGGTHPAFAGSGRKGQVKAASDAPAAAAKIKSGT